MSSGKATWSDRWHQLSLQARTAVIRDVQAPTKADSVRPPFIPVTRLTPDVVEELTAAGLVQRSPGASARQPERLVVPSPAVPFVHRIKNLAYWSLLAADGAERLSIYVYDAFSGPHLDRDLRPVLHQGEIPDPYISRGVLLHQYVPSHQWPEWAAKSLKQPLAEKLLAVIDKAGGILALSDLLTRFQGSDSGRVQPVLADLVNRLVLFEDLEPGTFALRIGFLAPVHEGLRRVREPQVRPPLVPMPPPSDLLPEGGYEIDDLRNFLIELSLGPARLKQNHALFQKEVNRFHEVLEPLPDWTARVLRLTGERRLDSALRWCNSLTLTRAAKREGVPWLELTKDGQQWLADNLTDQYRRFFEFARGGQVAQGHYSYYQGDLLFLGTPLLVYEARGKQSTWWVEVTPEERQRLREAFYAVFADLQTGQFVRFAPFLDRATFGPHNPLTLGGMEPKRVNVHMHGAPVPPLPEQREATARRALEILITERLLPLGCVQAGIAEDGSVCIARHARLDAYFGRPVSDEALAGPVGVGGRVLIQPDFSVILIGTMPAAAAELAPLCERAGTRGVHGTMQLKITREAVIGAVASGLSGEEIEERLTRHSSVPVPANVLHEVREWAGWVRTAEVASLVVVRCPDRATADRAVSALGRQAERLSDTLVALPDKTLGSAERNKLRQHGILVSASKRTGSSTTRSRKRR